MDWLKLFTLLVAVASVPIQADGPKKKIRIHLPQKVKHIHHHKKIYITNHPASSQYAPAYMPSAEGSVAVPTSALPGINHIVPLHGMDLYEEHQGRGPSLSAAASHLLPLYHARGYYGPTHTEVDEQEYDISASEPNESFGPSGYSAQPVSIASSHPSNRVKIIKLNDPPRKKVVKKNKPKRVPGRRRPPQPGTLAEAEHPVSTFHEQFYSDVDGSGTIRKLKKPPRVEKIIDGDTEHIHTYTEEHIHKLLFDQNSKYHNIIGVDPLAGMTAITRPTAINPFKAGAAIIAIPTHPYGGLSALGTMATPHFEYAAYNPREVTHDHIFHDHGEIPSGVDITKEALSLPKVSYNGQGMRIGNINTIKNKIPKFKKPIKAPSSDFSYYEGIYGDNRLKKNLRPSVPTSAFGSTAEENNFKQLSDYGIKKANAKQRNLISSFFGKSATDFRMQPSSISSPYSVSSTVVHDYKPNNFGSMATKSANLNKYKDALANFKENYANNFEYDTFGSSSSNFYTSEDKNDSGSLTLTPQKDRKKSISKQNVKFGGKDHVTYVDHLGNDPAINDDTPTALDNLDIFDQTQSTNLVTPTDVSFKSPSSIQDFISMLSSKSLKGESITLPEASNDNFQYVEAPKSSTPHTTSVTTPPSSTNHQSMEQSSDSRESKRLREANKNSNENLSVMSGNDFRKGSQSLADHQRSYSDPNSPTTVRGKLKYGDKI
ncbi:unnamed protein product [Pieris macdunnoughi]|uniref:Uncharacterized protein n=1 Tax=Pieris macdunnoughi TaxID=345717 RepID=A0A821LJD6_9NEOP|nr:unnamed protein product [Pieris macdunnoughi]